MSFNKTPVNVNTDDEINQSIEDKSNRRDSRNDRRGNKSDRRDDKNDRRDDKIE